MRNPKAARNAGARGTRVRRETFRFCQLGGFHKASQGLASLRGSRLNKLAADSVRACGEEPHITFHGSSGSGGLRAHAGGALRTPSPSCSSTATIATQHAQHRAQLDLDTVVSRVIRRAYRSASDMDLADAQTQTRRRP